MKSSKTTYKPLVKAVIIMVGFLVLVMQPLLVTVNYMSNSKHKVSFIDLDSDSNENQEQDISENYLTLETALILLIKNAVTQPKFSLNQNCSYLNFITDVTLPPPKVG